MLIIKFLGISLLMSTGCMEAKTRGQLEREREIREQNERWTNPQKANQPQQKTSARQEAEAYFSSFNSGNKCADSAQIIQAFESDIVSQNDAWRKPELRQAIRDVVSEHCK